MNKPLQLAASLMLTEKIKTPLGLLRVVLANYQPSGHMSVELVLDKPATKSGRTAPVASLSYDPPQTIQLGHGEFAAKAVHELMTKTFLDSGLFKPTGKTLPSGEIWRLTGTAMLEFNSAFAPPRAATRVSFPSHLFGRKYLDSVGKQTLIAEFDKQGYTEHSASGESVWVVREHCEQNRIPFVIYLVNAQDEVVGACVCKADLAKSIEEKNKAEGNSVVIVYESPRALSDPPLLRRAMAGATA